MIDSFGQKGIVVAGSSTELAAAENSGRIAGIGVFLAKLGTPAVTTPLPRCLKFWLSAFD